MYQIGDKVCYGTEGVCSIVRIQEMKVGGAKGKYYVLRPIYRESATVYVPLDNERLIARMRPVLSQQELEALLVGADDAPLRAEIAEKDKITAYMEFTSFAFCDTIAADESEAGG